MAQYQVTHTCGHTVTHRLYGKTSERESRIGWLKDRPCLSCAQRAEQSAAQAAADATGLPSLTGSPKQIDWAITIRANLLARVADTRRQFEALGQRENAGADKIADELGRFDAAAARIQQQAVASWWIDRRNSSVADLLREFVTR